MVLEKAHCPQTMLKNYNTCKSTVPKNNAKKPWHLKKHNA
jgi:hypothetical protein